MALNLFGFQISRQKDALSQQSEKTFAPPSNEDGALTISAAAYYGTYVDLDGTAKNEVELISRYREMAMQPEIESAIDDIVNEAIVQDDDGKSVRVVLDGLKQPTTIKKAIEERLHARGNHELLSFEANDTLCRQVSNREPQLEKFAALHDVIIFVGGRKSSNAKILFEACHKINHNTHFISTPEELDFTLLEGAENVGICGATSTPMWLMELVADRIKQQSISLHA
jgi:4-hydroxy-3-methylbut-2-enyl diphosphate reductase IspH